MEKVRVNMCSGRSVEYREFHFTIYSSRQLLMTAYFPSHVGLREFNLNGQQRMTCYEREDVV